MDGYIFILVKFISFRVISLMVHVKLNIVLLSGSFIGFTNREKNRLSVISIIIIFVVTLLRMNIILPCSSSTYHKIFLLFPILDILMIPLKICVRVEV